MTEAEDQILYDASKKLKIMQDMIHGANVSKGWWSDLETGKRKERNPLELICLMHSELSEAMEGVRKDLMDDHLTNRKMVEVELADTIIRILDFAGGFDLDVAGAVYEKFRYNETRKDHSVEERKKANGKKY